MALAMVVGKYRTGDRSLGLRSRLVQSNHILQQRHLVAVLFEQFQFTEPAESYGKTEAIG